MKISIIGFKGITASYGGFETLAEYLSIYHVKSGYEVTAFYSRGLKKINIKACTLFIYY